MGVKLLLADDSITIQKVVGIIFSNEDYELTVVDNGTLAIEKARETLPSIMLVDALMPGKSGFEVCQEIRQDPSLKNTPLLLMTGAFEPFDEEKALQCGADDFISKPFESQQLVEKVKALLEIGKSRAEAAPAAAVAAAVTEPEGMIPPPVAGPWEEAAPEMVAPFEPLPEMFEDTLAVTEPVGFEAGDAAFAEPAAMAVEVVEAAPGDDPWGVFDLVDLDEVPPPEQVEPVAFAAMEAEEPPVFDLYAEEPLAEEQLAEEPAAVEPSPQAVLPAGFDTQWGPLEEEVFAYQHDDLTPPGETFAVGMGEPLAALVSEPEQFTVESVEEPVAAPMASPAAVPPVAEEVVAAPAAAPPMPGIGEEQLRAILSQLSRETIERIVWEVVPDLAENLIREEIRKMKQGFGA